MPQKTLFETDDGVNVLAKMLTKLNQAMSGVDKVKTVEDLQTFINNLNRVYLEIKAASANL